MLRNPGTLLIRLSWQQYLLTQKWSVVRIIWFLVLGQPPFSEFFASFLRHSSLENQIINFYLRVWRASLTTTHNRYRNNFKIQLSPSNFTCCRAMKWFFSNYQIIKDFGFISLRSQYSSLTGTSKNDKVCLQSSRITTRPKKMFNNNWLDCLLLPSFVSVHCNILLSGPPKQISKPVVSSGKEMKNEEHVKITGYTPEETFSSSAEYHRSTWTSQPFWQPHQSE